MLKEKIIENQTALDGYEYGVQNAKTALPEGYQNDRKFLYLLDKAKNTVRAIEESPTDCPNPSASLAYSFGAQIEPVLKINSMMIGNDSHEIKTINWFHEFWLPRAESSLHAAQLDRRSYGKKCTVTHIFEPIIASYKANLLELEAALDFIRPNKTSNRI